MKFSEMNYKRPDIKQVESKFVEFIQQFEAAESVDQQRSVLENINQLRSEFSTYASLASVRNSINTKDVYYEAEQEFFDNNEPLMKDLNTRFYKALGNSRFKAELKQKFGNQLFNLADVSLKTFDQSVLEDLKEENKLGTEYTKLMASAEVEFNGEKMNLSALDAFSESTDRAVPGSRRHRRRSRQGEWTRYDDIRPLGAHGRLTRGALGTSQV